MGLEGELSVRLALQGGRIATVGIHSTRPDVADALLVGRTRAELAAAVPRLFSLCGQSQAAACALAGAAAMGEQTPPEELARWRDAVATETLRDAAWRTLLDAPRWLGERPAHEAVQAGRAALVFHRDRPADAGSIAAAAFGMPAEDWLARTSLTELDAWIDAGSTATARCQRRFRDDDAAMPRARAEPQLLAARNHADWLGDWIQTSRADPDFARRPTYGGAPAETGALARQQRQPLIAAMLQRSASRVPARFAARLLELALLLAGRQTIELGAMALPSGEGLAWVENGRGLLVHQVNIDPATARSTAYRIVAPTEWNFHPAGALAMALQDAPAPDAETVRQRAEHLVNSLDPCVACKVELEHA
jgi:coenzyme F420-reducing hydrogenase alpha subunit